VEEAYKKSGIYVRPTITIEWNAPVTNHAVVSVGGRVKRAGTVPFRPGLTLLQAIQSAGDLDPFGTKKRIFHTRGGKRQTLDLRKQAHQNFILKPGDTLEVDQKKIGDGI